MGEGIEYVNERLNPDPDGLGRCEYEFQMGEMRGKRCGLAKDVEQPGARCFWHGGKREFGPARDKREGLKKDLQGLLVQNAYLEGASLDFMDLSGASLQSAKLPGADLYGTDLRGVRGGYAKFGEANLRSSDLRGSDLQGADLRGIRLAGAKFSSATNLDDVVWSRGSQLRDEDDVEKCGEEFMWREEAVTYVHVAGTYLALKNNRLDSGDYERAAEFRYREMECRRKGAKWFSVERFWLGVYKWLCGGYGEKPVWILGLVAGTIVVWALLFALVVGIREEHTTCRGLAALGKGLYLSVVSFTTLGMGDLRAVGWVGQALVGAEALTGAFLMALFVVCFARKAIRG